MPGIQLRHRLAVPIGHPGHERCVVLGVLGGAGHFVLIRAFTHAPPSVLAPFVYVQLVAVLVLGYVVFDEFPDGWSLAGMAIIVLSGAWIAARQARMPSGVGWKRSAAISSRARTMCRRAISL